MIYELASHVLWLSLLLLLVSAFGRYSNAGLLGWLLFSLYWLAQIGHYLELKDFFNALVTLGAAFFCLYMSLAVLKGGYENHARLWASYAAAICGIVYYPFVELPRLNSWLIGQTAALTADLLHILGVEVSIESWNTLALNGQSVEIVLACTAIESIALFSGVILSVRAPPLRRIEALLVSTSAIYLLNLVRNAFVILAFGEQWFGEESFYLAHNVIAKVGSTLALLLIAYAVFSILPELLDQIDELAREIRPRRDAA
jgi:archaeosortase A (PGF-CTERM-specific)